MANLTDLTDQEIMDIFEAELEQTTILLQLQESVVKLDKNLEVALAKMEAENTPANSDNLRKATEALVRHRRDMVKCQSKLAIANIKAIELKNKIKIEQANAQAPTAERTAQVPNQTNPSVETDRGIQGSQLNSIPVYSGDEAEFEGWINLIGRAKTQFNWSDKQTAAAIKSKLSGDAGRWLRALEKKHTQGIDCWEEVINGQQPLKLHLET